MKEEDTRSDEELVTAFQRGEEDAFEVLFRRYYPQVYRHAWELAPNPPAAEGILQDVFSAVYRALQVLPDGVKFEDWVKRITNRIATNFMTPPPDLLKGRIIRSPLPKTLVGEMAHLAVLAAIPLIATIFLGVLIKQVVPVGDPVLISLMTVAFMILGALFFIITILVENGRNVKQYRRMMERIKEEEKSLFEDVKKIALSHLNGTDFRPIASKEAPRGIVKG